MSLMVTCKSVTYSEEMTKEDIDLPLYWGWFIQEEDSSFFLSYSQKLLEQTLEEVDSFLTDVKGFTNQSSIQDILQYYTRDNSDILHCTAMYNGVYPNYTIGAEDYANKPAVKVV